MDSNLGQIRGHNDTPCGWPAPGRPIGRLGSGLPQGVIGGFSYYQLVILIFNIVPLIMDSTSKSFASKRGFETTVDCSRLQSTRLQSRCGWQQHWGPIGVNCTIEKNKRTLYQLETWQEVNENKAQFMSGRIEEVTYNQEINYFRH